MALQGIGSATVHSGNIASGGEGRGFGPSQSPVLRIIVENLFYPVTLEVLQQVRQHRPRRGLVLLFVSLFVSLFVFFRGVVNRPVVTVVFLDLQ